MSSSAEHSDAMSREVMVATIAGLQAERAEMTAKLAALEGSLTDLAHENALLKRRLFGTKSERIHTSELQLALGDLLASEAKLQAELDASVDKAKNAAPKPDPSETNGKARPHGRRNLDASKLPRVPVEIRDSALEARGARLIRFEDSNQIAYRRGGFFVVVKRVAQYEVVEDSLATVIPAAAPAAIFPKALLHTSTVAHLVTSKFALGVPHYRLERDLLDQGMNLDRGLMSRYVEHAGNTLGATIVAAMWRDAIANGHMISTDATGALIQPTKAKDGRSLACKKGHFFTAVVDAEAVLFAYVERHTSEAVKAIFSEFRGLLQADASSVYEILARGRPPDTDDGVTLVACFAHCRRYFFEAALCRHPAGVQGLMRIRAMYAIDAAGRRAPREERTAFRATHLRPLMDDFFAWAASARDLTPGRNLATKALGYALNQEAELRNVLLDGNIPLDNTRAERALRKIVVGRKNWMFYGTDTHAEAAAAIFSIIATCRLHGIDPFVYLDEVLRVLPYWPQDRYLELAPQHWLATRARLEHDELERPLSHITIPRMPHVASETSTPAG
ncbi:MAG: IS66 family transposase [Actinobacteria bacterium]|nr:IS66 family transposase [Actinomycetota bacterium]